MAKQERTFIKEVCAIDLKAPGEKKKISPIDKATGLDGRVFHIDGQAQLKKLQDNGLKLVLNVAHGTSLKYGEDASGWFDDYELRDDGIYAALDLNELGTELLTGEKYKYLSPEYLVDYDTNEVELIAGVGLVNQPNLLNDALNQMGQPSQEPTQETPAMGDKTPTDEAADLQAQIDKLTADNEALTTQNAELVQQANTHKVDNAINSGKLLPAKRDYALALSANALDNYLELEAQTFDKTEDNGIEQEGEQYDNDLDSEVFKQMGIEG